MSLKNIEHNLCEFQKYKKGTIKPYKSRVRLDPAPVCEVCQKKGESGSITRCDLCTMTSHPQCVPPVGHRGPRQGGSGGGTVCGACAHQLCKPTF